jgi:hypothetical protein
MGRTYRKEKEWGRQRSTNFKPKKQRGKQNPLPTVDRDEEEAYYEELERETHEEEYYTRLERRNSTKV